MSINQLGGTYLGMAQKQEGSRPKPKGLKGGGGRSESWQPLA